jgi:hypothetical protein
VQKLIAARSGIRATDVVFCTFEWPPIGELDFDFTVLAREINGFPCLHLGG